MSKEKPTTKICKHCKTEIPYEAKVCPQCRKKQGGKLKWVIIAFIAICIIGAAAGGGNEEPKTDSADENVGVSDVGQQEQPDTESVSDVEGSKDEQQEKEPKGEETKEKYHVGDTWENKTLKMTYTSCYEFTDYNQYNAPADGNKIICAEFEFENIGDSDTTVMYTDFHGYADGYEASQNYAPEGTGIEFSVKMSAGRKGTGKVAFEVPEDAQEIEIEFSPNFWTSENVIFVYE